MAATKKNASRKKAARKTAAPKSGPATPRVHPENTVSIAEAAARLLNVRSGKIGMTHQRVRQLIRDKEIGANRNGHFFSVPLDSIAEFNRTRGTAKRARDKANGSPKKAAAASGRKKASRKPAAAAARPPRKVKVKAAPEGDTAVAV
jgi:hypothetical protein